MIEKICWACKYIFFDGGSPGYSEYTPGYGASIICTKNKWDISYLEDETLETFRDKLTMAKSCELFELREELDEHLGKDI